MQRTSAGLGHRCFASDDRFQPALPCGLFAAPSGFHNSILTFQRTNSYPFNNDCVPLVQLRSRTSCLSLRHVTTQPIYRRQLSVAFGLFLKDSRSGFVVQFKEWALSRSMLRKSSQGDGAPKAVRSHTEESQAQILNSSHQCFKRHESTCRERHRLLDRWTLR
jgi:hypothetical protein